MIFTALTGLSWPSAQNIELNLHRYVQISNCIQCYGVNHCCGPSLRCACQEANEQMRKSEFNMEEWSFCHSVCHIESGCGNCWFGPLIEKNLCRIMQQPNSDPGTQKIDFEHAPLYLATVSVSSALSWSFVARLKVSDELHFKFEALHAIDRMWRLTSLHIAQPLNIPHAWVHSAKYSVLLQQQKVMH